MNLSVNDLICKRVECIDEQLRPKIDENLNQSCILTDKQIILSILTVGSLKVGPL